LPFNHYDLALLGRLALLNVQSNGVGVQLSLSRGPSGQTMRQLIACDRLQPYTDRISKSIGPIELADRLVVVVARLEAPSTY
jgi:hypothetical protein